MILQSLVTSADKNLDGAMDWKEFEGFGDFELVFKRWPQMWKILQDDMLAGMNTCAGEDGDCFPSPWTTEDLKRCQTFAFLFDQHFVQVFLQARGDHATHPKLILPWRHAVPSLDSWRLVRSHCTQISPESPHSSFLQRTPCVSCRWVVQVFSPHSSRFYGI